MDLNRLYSDHQVLLFRAQAAATAALRRGFADDAALLAERIRLCQAGLGAAAARAWPVAA